MRAADRGDVLSARVKCGAECSTDHRLLVVSLRFQLRHMQRQAKKAMPRLNVSKLVSGRTGDAAVTKSLHDAVRQMLHREGWHADRDIDTSATGSWAKLSEAVFEVAKRRTRNESAQEI